MNEYVEASRVLRKMLEEERHLDECFGPASSPLSQQICYGAVRQYFLLDALVDSLLKKPLPPKHHDLKLLLFAALYSMEHLKRPAHASVNAAVNACGALNKGWAKGLVNGVLRSYGREGQALTRTVTDKSVEARLNHPLWLIDQIRHDWPEHPGIFDNNNRQAPMTLRVNLARTKMAPYRRRLTEAGIEHYRGDLSEAAVTLAHALPVTNLPGFAAGLVSVQDEASQLAPTFMNLQDSMQVLDACSAPGGKTCHLLEYRGSIRLTAVDRDSKRIGRVEENLNRLSLSANVICAELENLPCNTRFDRILLDVPCSATGIIRRHPDIKLLRKKSDIDKLSSAQRLLLNKAFGLLKTGGELLYSTCSILLAENDDVIADFLRKHGNAQTIPLKPPGATSVPTHFGLQLLPTAAAHDGFYYASLKKLSP